MSAIKLQGNAGGTGTLTVAAPSTNTNQTLTLPDNTGTLLSTASTFSGTGPAFSAYKGSTAQSITSSTPIQITYNLEEFDTNSNFASNRFTPTVAGYYQINATTYVQAVAAMTRNISIIYKNGSAYKYGNDNAPALTTESRSTVSSLVYLNGSTDYVEIWVLATGTTLTVNGTSESTYFSGSMVRAA